MNNELYHHGVEGMSWGKRNGPPYPLNAEGKADLRAQKKAAKKQKNIERGAERLENRKEYVNKKLNIDKQAAKLGYRQIKKSGQMQKEIKDIKHLADEIKSDPDRLAAFGKRTYHQRVATISASTVASGASIVAGLAAGSAIGLLPAAAVAGIGVAVYQQTKH